MRRAALACGLVLLLGAAEGAARGQVPGAAPTIDERLPSALTGAVELGHAWRLDTARGPVRVWTPAAYDPATAATVVYVHGYYTHVDDAWTEHQLAAQFALSGVNALFIACEAPAGLGEPVAQPSLRALLADVRTGIGQRLPRGPVVAIGHSGAFRTLTPWLANDQLATVVLLDAAYDPLPFARWARGSRHRRLIDVAEDALRQAGWLHRCLPRTVVIDGMPEGEELPVDAARASSVLIRSQVGHMALITDGVALPLMLRAAVRVRVADAPRVPLGGLPIRPAATTEIAALDGAGSP